MSCGCPSVVVPNAAALMRVGRVSAVQGIEVSQLGGQSRRDEKGGILLRGGAQSALRESDTGRPVELT
eukprot:692809-Pleurochrysis_carterae.AAC.1